MRPAGTCGPRDPELPVLSRSNGAYRLLGMKVQKSQPISRRPTNCKKLMASRRSRGRAFFHVGRYHPLLNSHCGSYSAASFSPVVFFSTKHRVESCFTKVATTSHPDSPD